VDAAWQAAAWTMGAILVVAGIATLAGGAVAAILSLAAAGVVLVLLLRRHRRQRGTRARVTPLARWASGGTAPQPAAPLRPTTAPVRELPVAKLSTAALGSEWLRTTSALAGRLQPAARASIVRRRQETLDELERRDPVGFARWIAAGAAPDSNPAEFVHGDARGDRAAGSDAA
jgi:hypothetical protein